MKRNIYKDTMQKICPCCGELKGYSEYSKASKRPDGIQVYCKLCRKETAKGNKTVITYFREYRKNNNYKEWINKPNVKERICENQKRSHLKLKLEVFNAYGGAACSCCGEKEISFLVIDHINGGGTKQRKTMKSGNEIYRWLRINNYPQGFRVLCHNCNWGIHLNHGICPHKKI